MKTPPLLLALAAALAGPFHSHAAEPAEPAKPKSMRLKFQAYDGVPGKDDVSKMSFQVITLDLRQPSQFLKLGDMISGTDFKLKKFEFKESKTLERYDISELTIVETKTGREMVLIYNTEYNAIAPPAR